MEHKIEKWESLNDALKAMEGFLKGTLPEPVFVRIVMLNRTNTYEELAKTSKMLHGKSLTFELVEEVRRTILNTNKTSEFSESSSNTARYNINENAKDALPITKPASFSGNLKPTNQSPKRETESSEKLKRFPFYVNLKPIPKNEIMEEMHENGNPILNKIRNELRKSETFDPRDGFTKMVSEIYPKAKDLSTTLKSIEAKRKDDLKNSQIVTPIPAPRRHLLNKTASTTASQANGPDFLKTQLTHNKFTLVGAIKKVPKDCRKTELYVPYLVEKIKRWGCNFLKPDNTSGFSRINFFNLLVSSAEPEVIADILQIMTKFQTSLPLIIPTESEKCKLLTMTLENCVIKWKPSRTGKVLSNHLFNDPFTLVVVARIGSRKPNERGWDKTTILHQHNLFRAKNHFASANEGNPENRVESTGFVEFTWLTEDVCSDTFWAAIQKAGFYEENEKKIILLANLHGDALKCTEVLQTLSSFKAGFLVFAMPDSHDYLQVKMKEFQQLINNDRLSVVKWCVVDPVEDVACDDLMLDSLTTDSGELSQFIISTFKEVDILRQKVGSIPFDVETAYDKEYLHAKKHAEEFIKYVSIYGVEYFIDVFGQPHKESFKRSIDNWEQEPAYKATLTTFIKIFDLPLKLRQWAFGIIDIELTKLARMNLDKIQGTIDEYENERNSILEFSDNATKVRMDNLDKLIGEMYAKKLQKIEIHNFVREIGKMYEAFLIYRESEQLKLNQFENTPQQFAEMVLNGTTLELLDSTISEISITWLGSVFHEICKQTNELRVFVLSVLGLQSSGKSTLLNALFGCKFPESVGPCTSGLFLRLLNLAPEYREKFKVDAIILIDSEGLGSAEKLNKNYHELDRLLATFAMCISDLTLINILGETQSQIVEILEIVLLTLARLEEVNIFPNIHLVQHLKTKDETSTKAGIHAFSSSLRMAMAEIRNRSDELVITNCKVLVPLENNLRTGKMIQTFGNFKSGGTDFSAPSIQYHEDIEEFYIKILDIVEDRKLNGYQSFHFWHSQLNEYWEAIKSDNFVKRFRNIKEMSTFLERNNQYVTLKALNDIAFQSHVSKLREENESIVFWLNTQNSDPKQQEAYSVQAIDGMKKDLSSIPSLCDRYGGQKCRKCNEVQMKLNELFNESTNQDMFMLNFYEDVKGYIERRRNEMLKQLLANFEAKMIIQSEENQPKDQLNVLFNPAFDRVMKEETEEDRIKYKSNPEARFALLADKIVEITLTELQQKHNPESVVEIMKKEIHEAYIHLKDNWLKFLQGHVIDLNLRISHTLQDENLTLPPSWIEAEKDYLRNLEAFDAAQQIITRVVSWRGKPPSKYIDYPVLEEITNKFLGIPMAIRMELKNADQYQQGMILNLKSKVQQILDKFGGKVSKKYKLYLTGFAIRIFSDYMQKLNLQWNQTHQPYCLIDIRREHFIKQIRYRLLPPDSVERKGLYLANELLNGIKRYVEDKLSKSFNQSARKTSWIQSVFSVRVKYFTSLALEVEAANLQNALNHFRSPRTAIRDWFLIEIDRQLEHEKNMKTNKEYFFEVVSNFISHLRTVLTPNDLEAIAVIFLGTELILEIRKANIQNSADLQLLLSTIINVIEQKRSAAWNEVKIRRPSEDPFFENFLGCIAHCHWCGALCWGYKGHENALGMPLHHTCHQPRGLFGCTDTQTQELVVTACEFNECGNKAITRCDGDWKQILEYRELDFWDYAPNSLNQMQSLMEWFFLKLMNALAKEYGVHVPNEKNLDEAGFNNIRPLKYILRKLDSEILLKQK